MSVGEVAAQYKTSLAAVAKHLDVLQRAGLVNKTRRGKEQIVSLNPAALAEASDFLEAYRRLWDRRLESLDKHLKNRKG